MQHFSSMFNYFQPIFRRKEMLYLTTHSTHFIYGYMASDIWLRTIQIAIEETRCRHMGYSFRLTARVLLYAPSNRHDSTYHGLCFTSRGALVGTRNSSMGPPHEGSIRRPISPWANERSYHGATSRSLFLECIFLYFVPSVTTSWNRQQTSSRNQIVKFVDTVSQVTHLQWLLRPSPRYFGLVLINIHRIAAMRETICVVI